MRGRMTLTMTLTLPPRTALETYLLSQPGVVSVSCGPSTTRLTYDPDLTAPDLVAG